ncbi:hypothetical protein V8E55_005965 [Tylopilus felleus]
MTTTHTLLPTNKISIIGIWVETVFYGISCAMYVLCMFTLLREGKVPTLRWVLLVMSTILFLLCTAHVGISLRQLLDAFIYEPAVVPDYSTTYWLNLTITPRVLKDAVYDTLVLAKYIIQIWRLYVVFMHDWRVVILPIILLASCVGSAYASVVICALPHDEFHGSVFTLVISAGVLEVTLNMLITTAIVARLWWIGRKTASLTATSTNRFASSIYIIIESGIILAICGAFVLALFASNSPAALTGLDVVSQLIVFVAVLIIVRAAQTDRYRFPQVNSSRTMVALLAQREITTHAGASRAQSLSQDPLLHTTLSRSPSFVHDVQP